MTALLLFALSQALFALAAQRGGTMSALLAGVGLGAAVRWALLLLNTIAPSQPALLVVPLFFCWLVGQVAWLLGVALWLLRLPAAATPHPA